MFSTLEVAACHAMHLLHSIAKQPNLKLKTWSKQLLGSLPLDITLHGQAILPCFVLLALLLVAYKSDNIHRLITGS